MTWFRNARQRRVAATSAVLLGVLAVCAATLTVSGGSDLVVSGYDEAPASLEIADSVASPDGSYVYVVGTIAHSGSGGTLSSGSWSSGTNRDLFVGKYDSSGSRVNTYVEDIGVGGDDYGKAIAVDADGDIYVTGQAYSSGRSYSKIFIRKLTSSLSTVGSPYIYSNPSGNNFDSGNDIAVSSEGGTYYAYTAATLVNGSGDKDIQVFKLSWPSSTPTSAWSMPSKGSFAGSSSSEDSAVKIVVQYGTISIANVPTTDTFIYVAGQKNNDALCMNFTSSGTRIHSGTYDYQGGLDKVTGMAVAASGTNRVFVSTTSDRTGGGTDMALVCFDKRNMTLTPTASAWTGTWHAECTPSTGSVGVVIEPTNNKPIVGGYIQGSSLTSRDFIAVPWSADASTPGTRTFFGGKYEDDIPSDMGIDGNGQIYIVGGRTGSSTISIGTCSETPCAEPPNPCTEDEVGIASPDVQAYVVAFTVSGGTSISPVGEYLSGYTRVHMHGTAAPTSSALFASYDYTTTAYNFNSYVAVYHLY